MRRFIMAWSPTQSGYMNPGRFFPGCSGQLVVGGVTGVFIPYSSLESYGTSTSGDVRELAYSILDKVASGMAILSTANKPTKFTISKSVSATETSAQKTYIVVSSLNAINTIYDIQDE
jgi:hypothetical protein